MIPSSPRLPLIDRLPSPTVAVDTSFDFVERLMGAQRAFTMDVASLMAKKPAPPVVTTKKATAA
jgi:hypothetical protein